MFSFHLEEFMFSYKRPNLNVTINATRPYEHRFQKCCIHYRLAHLVQVKIE